MPFASTGSGGFSFDTNSFNPVCDGPLMSHFSQTYHPFLQQQCGSCHTAGPGTGNFSHPDIMTAYSSFRGLTRARVERNIVNPAHQPPFTGTQHIPVVTNFTPGWEKAEADYNSCMGKSGIGLVTTPKANGLILQRAGTNTWTRLEWDLFTEAADMNLRSKVPLIASIEARVAVIAAERRGYEFRNPMVKIKEGYQGPWRLMSMHLHINNEKMLDVSTYSYIDVSVNSTTDTNISPNTSFALAVRDSVNANDTFAIEFGEIRNSDGGSIITDPGNGGGGNTTLPPLPASVTLTQLLSNDANLGVFRQNCTSCHSSANAQGSFNITNVTQARNAASLILRLMTNTNDPMPPSGILNGTTGAYKIDLVRIWVNGGAQP